jgi:hypothetical protein
MYVVKVNNTIRDEYDDEESAIRMKDRLTASGENNVSVEKIDYTGCPCGSSHAIPA